MYLLWKILLVSILFILTDSIYLFSSKAYFQDQVFLVQKSGIELRIVPTILCYVALIFGLWYFILREKKSWKEAFLFGIVIYSVYETTNYATLKAWKPQTVIMDTLWGGILFALVTKAVYLLNI
jgi:uncharacterized membrane protein